MYLKRLWYAEPKQLGGIDDPNGPIRAQWFCYERASLSLNTGLVAVNKFQRSGPWAINPRGFRSHSSGSDNSDGDHQFTVTRIHRKLGAYTTITASPV
jgi:hypothetical protein